MLKALKQSVVLQTIYMVIRRHTCEVMRILRISALREGLESTEYLHFVVLALFVHSVGHQDVENSMLLSSQL